MSYLPRSSEAPSKAHGLHSHLLLSHTSPTPIQRASKLARKPLYWFRGVCRGLSFLWCKSRSALRSLIGRWKSHTGLVDIGPAFRLLPDGLLVHEPRTDARSKDIDIELAKYPWLDLIDRQIFLDGWTMGERYGRDSSGNETCTPVEWS
jgi:hypothetical protein